MQLFFGTDDGVCVFFGGKELYLAVMWSWEVGKKCNFNGSRGSKISQREMREVVEKTQFQFMKNWMQTLQFLAISQALFFSKIPWDLESTQ